MTTVMQSYVIPTLALHSTPDHSLRTTRHLLSSSQQQLDSQLGLVGLVEEQQQPRREAPPRPMPLRPARITRQPERCVEAEAAQAVVPRLHANHTVCSALRCIESQLDLMHESCHGGSSMRVWRAAGHSRAVVWRACSQDTSWLRPDRKVSPCGSHRPNPCIPLLEEQHLLRSHLRHIHPPMVWVEGDPLRRLARRHRQPGGDAVEVGERDGAPVQDRQRVVGHGPARSNVLESALRERKRLWQPLIVWQSLSLVGCQRSEAARVSPNRYL